MTREHYDRMLRELDDAVVSLGMEVSDRLQQAISALQRQDADLAMQIIERDREIDEQRQEIEQRTITLIALQQPVASDLRMVASVLTIVTELERMGDYCKGIARLTLRMAGEPLLPPFSEIQEMATVTQQLLLDAMGAYRERNLIASAVIYAREDDVDIMYQRTYRELLAAMVLDPDKVRRGTYLLWIAHNLERIADRVANIVERVAYMVTGDVATFRNKALAHTPPR